MSLRSFLEFNHDLGPRTETDCLAFGFAMRSYASDASNVHALPAAMTKIDSRHHSDRLVAAREGYGPAQDECAIEEIAKIISGAPFPSRKSLTKARAILEMLMKPISYEAAP